MNQYSQKWKQERMISDFKGEFIDLAREDTYPGITGNVRMLEAKIEPGYAEIILSSASDVLNMNDDDFYLSLSTAHPQSEDVPVGESSEDDYRRVKWTHTHRNVNLRSDVVPSLDEPIWFAVNVDAALNEQPVVASEALMLLSHHLQES